MTQPAPAGSRAVSFILITMVIDTIGFGIIAPVLPELIMELTGEGLGAAAEYGGWLLFVFAATQFVCAPVLGNLSDRFGRRPVLLASLLALGVDYVLMGFAPTLAWLFVGRIVSGAAGATFATANAYVADVSPADKRAANFGLIGAAWGVGFILGPVLGGILGEYGPRVPFFAAAMLALVNVAYGFLVLPESLPADQRRAFSWKRANPVGALLHLRRYPVLFGLFGVIFLYQIAHDSLPSTWTYYTMLKFGWTEREVGYSMGAIGVGTMIVMGGLIRVVVPRIGEVRAVIFGFGIWAASFLGFAFAPSGAVMYALIVPFSLGGFAMPALRGIMTHQVPANAQGELMGAISSLQSLTAIGAPVFMTQLFGYYTAEPSLRYFPGAPFFAAGVLVIAAIMVFLAAMPRQEPAVVPETVDAPETGS